MKQLKWNKEIREKRRLDKLIALYESEKDDKGLETILVSCESNSCSILQLVRPLLIEVSILERITCICIFAPLREKLQSELGYYSTHNESTRLIQ